MSKLGTITFALLWGAVLESISPPVAGFYLAAALLASCFFLNFTLAISWLNAALAALAAFLVTLFWAWRITELFGISSEYAMHLAVYFGVLFVIFIFSYDR